MSDSDDERELQIACELSLSARAGSNAAEFYNEETNKFLRNQRDRYQFATVLARVRAERERRDPSRDSRDQTTSGEHLVTSF